MKHKAGIFEQVIRMILRTLVLRKIVLKEEQQCKKTIYQNFVKAFF